MAVPKQKTSKSKKGMRRSHRSAVFKNIVEDKKAVNTGCRIMLMLKLECITANKFSSLKFNK